MKTYTKDKSNANRQNMTEARAAYKSHIRKKQYMYKKGETQKLEKCEQKMQKIIGNY